MSFVVTEHTASGADRGARTPRRAPWQPVAELVLIAAAVALIGGLGHRVLGAMFLSGTWWMLPVCASVGVLLADFSSGAVHWLGDSFLREDSAVVGPLLIAPFREHHRDPEGITRHGFLELHGNSCIPIVAVLGVAFSVGPDLASPGWLVAHTLLLFFA